MLTDFRANVIPADPPLSSINTVAIPASPADRQLLQADMDMEAIPVQRIMATQTVVQPGEDIRTHHPTRSMSRTRSSVFLVLESSVADTNFPIEDITPTQFSHHSNHKMMPKSKASALKSRC